MNQIIRYKKAENFFSKRIDPLKKGALYDLDEINDQKIIKVLNNFIKYLNSQNQTKVIYNLNQINEIAKTNDICNHPCFIANSIYQNILLLLSPETPFDVVCAAALAISSFSYLFSLDSKSNSSFNIDDLFLILEPEILFFIFDCIKENITANIASLTKMYGHFSIYSKNFHDELLASFSVESIIDLINFGIDDKTPFESKYNWIRKLFGLLCDLCYYPITKEKATSIFTFFYGLDFISMPIEIDYKIIHTIRYIIEYSESSEIGWNPADLLLESRIPEYFDQFLTEMNKNKDYINDQRFQKYLLKTKDDICGIALSIFLLTGENKICVLPISQFINFIEYDKDKKEDILIKQSLTCNALTFFSYYMNESRENFEECDEKGFFINLKPAIQFQSAKIRIHAGYVLNGLIENANNNLLDRLFQHGFFIYAFRLILLDNVDLSIKMLFVMMKFIQFVIESDNNFYANDLKDSYENPENGMDQTLEQLYDGNEDDDYDSTEDRNDLSIAAGLTLEELKKCFDQFGLIDLSQSDFDEIEEDSFNENQFDNNDENICNDDEIDFEKYDQLFYNTKPDPWIK